METLSSAAAELLAGVSGARPWLARLASGKDLGDPYELREVVDGGLSELSLQPLTRRQAKHIVMAQVAEGIVDGTVPPYGGAQDIWIQSEGLPPEERPNDIIALVSDWDERPADQAGIEADIIEAARRLAPSEDLAT